MSIVSQIERIQNNISAAYSACESQGATMPQLRNSNNLAQTIGSISAGGGVEPEKKAVNFYDFDGTRLYSYTFAEALQLSALPGLPSHDGLTAQEWNCTLAKIQTSAQISYPIDVGATYVTSDGATRFYFFVAKGTKLPDFQIHMYIPGNTSVTVDWGDGTTETVANTGTGFAAMYAEKTGSSEVNADTVVCVRIIGGSFKLGSNENYINMYGNNTTNNTANNGPVLTKVEFGSNCTEILDRTFCPFQRLSAVVLPNNITIIGQYAFSECSMLKAAVLPKNITLSGSVFNYANALERVVAGNSRGIHFCALRGCYGLTEYVVPFNSGVVDRIFESAFSYCCNLLTVKLPSSINEIFGEAFKNCSKLYSVDLTAYTDPSRIPSLRHTNAFSYTSAYLKFKVANQTMLNAFSTATNWSAYASNFVIA